MTAATSASTGPRTDAGKAASSRNAVRNGLYANRDFILAGEQEEYTDTLARLWAHLQPQGVLEETFAAEIMTATWRLRRCRLAEATLALGDDSAEDLAKEQKSIDRARAQANNTLRRSTAELRKLQTEAATRAELAGHGFDVEDFPGLADSRQLLRTIQTHHRLRSLRKQSAKPAASAMGSSFCNSAQHPVDEFLSNAECPCRSGKKYLLCCGKTDA